jgi:GT2 family glycosyltransferase
LIFARAQSLPLSIVIADLSGGDRLIATLRGLRAAHISLACEVIGVVGGSDPTAVSRLRAEFPLVALYQTSNSEDLGVLYGIGCAAAAGKQLLLLDGTVQIEGPTIYELVVFMEQGPWVAMVAPRLVNAHGDDVVPGRAFPTVGSAIAEFGKAGTAQNTPGAVPRLKNPLDRRITTPKEVDAVVSGCCLVKRQALEQVGVFSPGYSPGGETLDWCRRARQGGWAIFYHPGQAARLLGDDRDDPRRAAIRLAVACGFIRRHRGLLDLLALKLLLAFPIARGLLLGGIALVPGMHRARSQRAYLRAWHALEVLLDPRHAGQPRPA